MILPQILELAEEKLKKEAKKESFGIFITPECFFRLKEFLLEELTLAYNQGSEKYEELKKGIDKLPRNVFKEIRDHEFIETRDIYILLQRIKNQGLEEGKKLKK